MPDRISAEDAAGRLGLSVDDLLKLRRRGRLRGFPDYGNWVFERADVDALAEELGTEVSTSESATGSTDLQDAPPETDDDPQISSYSPTSYEPVTYRPISEAPDTDPTDITSPDPGHRQEDAEQTPGRQVPAAMETPAPASRPATDNTGTPSTVAPLAELCRSDSPISSAMIIASLAKQHGVDFEAAAGVVDGFWDYLLDVRHYRQGRRKLNMPHFGTFSLQQVWEESPPDSLLEIARKQDSGQGETELVFQSQQLAQLAAHREQKGPQPPNTAWIDHWQQRDRRNETGDSPLARARREDGGDRAQPAFSRLSLSRLSLKRRIAVTISRNTGLELRTTFLILWDLIETITGIMTTSSVEIRWATRGVMRPRPRKSATHYEFRTYKRLRDRLPRIETARHERSRSARRRPARRRSNSQDEAVKTAKWACGCLFFLFFVLPILLAILASLF